MVVSRACRSFSLITFPGVDVGGQDGEDSRRWAVGLDLVKYLPRARRNPRRRRALRSVPPSPTSGPRNHSIPGRTSWTVFPMMSRP